MDNRKPEKVRFHIVRKSAFAGALLTYKLFVNGEYVGALKNGKSLDVDIPKSDFYFIDEMWSTYERNAIICASDLNNPSQISIEIRRNGGWKTASYNEFFVMKNGEYVNLPSFDYTHYFQACFDDNLFSELTEQERILTRCLEFYNKISDGADEVLLDERLFEMLDALQSIGATQYTRAFISVIDRTFRGIPLPLNDEMTKDKDILKRMDEANQIVWDFEKQHGSAEELHKCLVTYIIEYLF